MERMEFKTQRNTEADGRKGKEWKEWNSRHKGTQKRMGGKVKNGKNGIQDTKEHRCAFNCIVYC